MLARDIRKAEKRKVVQRIEHQRFLERSEKWARCPNHGLVADKDRLVNNKRLQTKPLEVIKDGREMVCYECKSVWLVHDNLTHP